MARFSIDTVGELLDECVVSVRAPRPDLDKLHEKNTIISNGLRYVYLKEALDRKALPREKRVEGKPALKLAPPASKEA